MHLTVKVTPKAKLNKIEKISGSEFKIWTTAAPDKGKANAAVIKLLSQELGIPPSHFTIIQGASSRHKIIQIS